MGSYRRGTMIASIVAALALYATLGAWVRRHPQPAFELAITRWIQRRIPPIGGRLLGWISWLGFPPQNVLIPSGIILGFWVRGDRTTALRLFLTWTASTVSFVTKRLVRRPRPNHPTISLPIAQPHDASYPSGHVVTYTAFWGTALGTLARRAPWTWLRIVLWSLAAVLLGGVGLSRIYLGHHWFTDVLGGYLLGGSWSQLVRVLGERENGCGTWVCRAPSH